MATDLSVIIDDPHVLCAADSMSGAGLNCNVCSSAELASAIADGSAAVALIDGATLQRSDWHLVEDAVAAQPVWSALPFILLITREELPQLEGAVDRLVNVTALEPPVTPHLLALAIRTGVRARERQRRSADLLAQSMEMEAKLEQQVREQTGDLRTVNRQLRREVAERRRVEMELRESEEMYRYTVELSHQLAWTASTDLRIITITETFRDITGLPDHLEPHEGWLEVMHPDDLGPTITTWQRAAPRRCAARSCRS